jgi:Fe-S-cluster containining protein
MSEEQKTEGQKKKFNFTCTKCGTCCLARGPIPLVFDDIVGWAKAEVVKNFMPYIKFIKTSYGNLDLVLSRTDKDPFDFMDEEEGDEKKKKEDKKEPKPDELVCPMFNKEKKECLVYQYRPLSCRTYPLEFDGQKYQIVDTECPGIDQGEMTPEARKEMRELAQKMNQQLAQMRIIMPVIAQSMQPFVIRELMEAQKKYMEALEKMPPEERAKIEEEMRAQMKAGK